MNWSVLAFVRVSCAFILGSMMHCEFLIFVVIALETMVGHLKHIITTQYAHNHVYGDRICDSTILIFFASHALSSETLNKSHIKYMTHK